MAKIRLTKEFTFEMAHALWNYDGKCRHIHGHSYRLFVTVIGEPNNDPNNVKYGMVMDFGDLKKIVREEIIDTQDHAVILSKEIDTRDWLNVDQMFDKCEFVDYQPTCENLIADYAERIKKHLPENVKLHSLKLYETHTSYAEWYAEDNH